MAALALLCAPGLAWATFIPPAGVTAYRLAFATSGLYAATSSSISTYNTDVSTEAATNSALPSTTWSALVSTSSVSALDNADCGASCDALPIYLVDGTLVATSLSNLFSGAPSSRISEDANGVGNATFVWTGSNADGTQDTGLTMGSTDVAVGSNSTNVPVSQMFNDAAYPTGVQNGAQFELFAISGAITVQTPEPASGALFVTAGVILAAALRRRSR